MPWPQEFDAHTHRYVPGVPGLINAVREDDWTGLLNLGIHHPDARIALGVHPWYAKEWTASSARSLRCILEHRPSFLVAIGEIGLDFQKIPLNSPQKHPVPPKVIQLQCLEDQINLAQEFHLPICLHLRKAWDVFLPWLKRRGLSVTPGSLVHNFTGSNEIAWQLIGKGFSLSFGPVHTRNPRLLSLAATIPREQCLYESDMQPSQGNVPGYQDQPAR